MKISIGPALTDAEAAELRERFRTAVLSDRGRVLDVLPAPLHVCYSRGMTNEIVALLKAKRDAVQALAFALEDAVRKTGTVTSAEAALEFTKTWVDALDSMVPTDED